jgi:hypothetical protein
MRARVILSTPIAIIAFSLAAWGGQGPPQQPAAPPPGPAAPFYAHIVATGLRGGYQVVAADLNKDGRPDLIGLGSQMTELLWYENPYWTPHVITRDAARMINLAAADTDRDGIPELGLAYEFTSNPARGGGGKLAILKANGDPKGLWSLRQIDALPTSHRVRFANIGGQPVLVNAPILGASVKDGFADSARTPTPLRAYRAPDWKPETITDANLGVVHGLFTGDWDGDGRDDALTAGYLGVHAHSLGRNGVWTRTELAKGDPAEWPRGGASDVAVGRLNGRTFFVTNEPFHGNQVVVYQRDADGTWPRNVIETEIVNSHSLVLVDSDGDGSHEIVSGGTRGAAGTPRGSKPGVFFYKAADPSAQRWERMVLDPEIAANACVAVDINGDKRTDVACIDNGSPWTLRWYENRRP